MKTIDKIIILICLSCFSACSNGESLEQALTYAGYNRAELEKVLDHYKHDSLKYRAAKFLIENMPGKYGIEAENPDDAYKRFLANIPQKDSINWKLDSCHVGHLLDSVSMVAAPRMRKVEDIKTITSALLIENIDYAFKAWEESGYSYGFEDFCHYILPYRIGHEPLSSWRSDAYRRYIHLLDSGYTPREVAVSMAMNGGIRYNIGMSKYPYKQSYGEMAASRWGGCEEMAAYLALSLRAVGIPAAIDYVPVWANRSSGHCWNVLKDTTGRFVEVGFDPGGKNRVIYKPSKIYRHEYMNGKDADVTSHYAMPLSDLHFSLPDSCIGKPAALCTFDNRNWAVAALARVEKDGVSFPSVGRGVLWGGNELRMRLDVGEGIVYLLQLHDGKDWQPAGEPFILQEDGQRRPLVADTERTERVVLYRKYPYSGEHLEKPFDSNNIFADDEYELRYWKEGWHSLGRQTAMTDSLVYENVPTGALLWLHNLTRGREERIFTCEDGKQVWW